MPVLETPPLTDEELRLRNQRRWRLARWGTLALALVIGAVLGARPAFGAIKGWQARRHAARATELMRQERWVEARTAAVEALQLRFTEPEAVRAVARFLSRTGQAQEALEFWARLRELTRDGLGREDRRDEANAALAAGDVARAGAEATRLLEDPGAAGPADYLLGALVAARQGRPADAAGLAQKVLAAGPAATGREQLNGAVLAFTLASAPGGGGAENAGPAQERLVALARGQDAVGLDALTLLARQAGSPNPPPAVPPPADLARALEEHPFAKPVHRLLAVDLRARAEPAKAPALVDGAVARFGAPGSDPADLAALGAWLAAKNLPERVLGAIPLERALGSRELFLGHVDALAALGRWREVKELLNADRFPLDPVVRRLYLARCSVQLGEDTAAANQWAAALREAGTDVGKLMNVADYAEKNGALPTAAAAYTAAAAAAPKLRAAHQGRLRLARETPDVRAALADMLRQWPEDPAVRNDEAYTGLLLGSGDPKAAERTAEELLAREPASLPHRVLLALARLQQDRPAAALEAFAGVQLAAGVQAPPSALAVHAAALAANGWTAEARQEAAQAAAGGQLRTEERALITALLEGN